MMRWYNDKQKNIFPQSYMELANLAVAAMIFGQFLGNQKFNWIITISGFVLYIIIHIASYLILKN